MSLSYEQQRAQNIKENEDLLRSLGLTTPSRPALQHTPSNSSIKKRPRPAVTPKPTPTKVRKTTSSSTPVSVLVDTDTPSNSGLRRSARGSASAKRSYKELNETDVTTGSPRGKGYPGGRVQILDGDFIDDDDDEDTERVGKLRNNKSLGVRTEDPKQYGHIPGVEVGRWWSSRQECSTDAIHAPFVAGISGNPTDGAWSVALSGGYPDDVDLGTAFTYTGSGGRDLKGTKQQPKNLRTAPQTTHQTFDNPMNAALKRSAETRKPVRVIRGYKLPSQYAPEEGYRYDGLYVVEKAWMAKGLTKGLLVCRYAFKRVPGQPALPVRKFQVDEDAEA